ncbi:MAG: DUF4097 domain-containing protein [Oscillospiraceae bacterium]|nr:DUF4097 domain-containing protein [Oscillospiraceae bacterium]
MKIKITFKTIIFLSVLALASLILTIVTQYIAVAFFGFESSVYRLEEKIDFKKYVNIEVTNIPLFVDVYNGDVIKITYISETDLITEETSYGVTIKQDPDFSFSLFSKEQLNYHMRVLLPDRIYNNVTIISTSGEVTMGYIYTNELNVSGRSGNLNISDTGGRLNVNTVSADINISFLEFNEMVFIETLSGDVNILMPHNKQPKLTFLTQSGAFTSDFFRFSYNKNKGNNYSVMGDNPIKFQVITKSGDLEFMKKIIER